MPKQAATIAPARKTAERVRDALAWLEKHGTKRNRDGIGRYGITVTKLYGVSIADIQKLAKQVGQDHELALALWDTGWYEARLLTAFIDDPAKVTAAQMDRWVRDFDNWGICDTLCFKLFDRTPHAWRKVEQWSRLRDEYGKRTAFALLASLALHDRTSGDAPFLRSLKLVERASSDERNFVKKGVNWALRAVGERNAALNKASIELAQRLAESEDPTERWMGKDVLKALKSPAVRKRLARRGAA
jgi:3-methyladenine DNA glycosylase AlkD